MTRNTNNTANKGYKYQLVEVYDGNERIYWECNTKREIEQWYHRRRKIIIKVYGYIIRENLAWFQYECGEVWIRRTR